MLDSGRYPVDNIRVLVHEERLTGLFITTSSGQKTDHVLPCMENLVMDHVLEILICALPHPIHEQCSDTSQHHLPRNVGDVKQLQVDQTGVVNGIQVLVGQQFRLWMRFMDGL